MPMFCCHCVAFSPALGRSPKFSCPSTYFHERFALTIDKRRARSSCCEIFLPLAPCFFFTATKSLHCSSCCGVALNFISSTAVPIFTDDFGQLTPPTLHLTRHTSQVILHTSHVTRHASHVTRFKLHQRLTSSRDRPCALRRARPSAARCEAQRPWRRFRCCSCGEPAASHNPAEHGA